MGCLHVIRARARVVFVCARVGGNPTILLILMLLLLLLLLLHYCCSYCCCSYYCCSYYLFDVIVCDPRARARDYFHYCCFHHFTSTMTAIRSPFGGQEKNQGVHQPW